MNEKLTIQDIAGFCPEEAVWKMMADVSTFLIKDKKGGFLTPYSIEVDGNTFIVETCNEAVGEYLAPEQDTSQMLDARQMVWTLGSIAYYMATGHVVFGGHGSNYQKDHPSAPLPVLPKGLQELTPILQKCLCHAPHERISMQDLNDISLHGLKSCEERQRKLAKATIDERKEISQDTGDKWPEEMIEI